LAEAWVRVVGLFGGGVGVDGVHGAERVDKGGAGVHGHGDTQGFGDFLAGGAGFQGGVGVDGDATVATCGDGNGEGDELADFFAEVGVGGVGVGESLLAPDRVGRELHEVSELGADLFLIIIPIEHH